MLMTKIFKTHLAFLSGIILTTAAPQIAAAQNSAPLAGLYACETISSSTAQLACFRAETAKLRAAETSGDVIAVEKETFAEIKQAEVKAEVKKVEAKKEKEKKAKTAKLRSLPIKSARRFGASRYYRFTLENGEVWQQAEQKSVRLGKANPDILTIKRSAIGGGFAQVNDKGQWFRVKKIR